MPNNNWLCITFIPRPTTVDHVGSDLHFISFFNYFPIWGWRREFLFPKFFGHILRLSLYSCLLHVFLYNICSPQFLYSYLLVYTHFHLLITSSSSVFLSTCPSLVSLLSHLYLPHQLLLLFLHPDLLNPRYSNH